MKISYQRASLIRTVLYKSLAISLSLMDRSLHCEKFTSATELAGAPLLRDSANETHNTNNNEESIVTKCPIESVTGYSFVCSAQKANYL